MTQWVKSRVIHPWQPLRYKNKGVQIFVTGDTDRALCYPEGMFEKKNRNSLLNPRLEHLHGDQKI